MRRTTPQSVEDLFQKLGETPLTRRARADSLFRRLRETEEDEFLGTFIRAPKPRKEKPSGNGEKSGKSA
ncbi:MAG: hypothetical protein R3C60_10370 [Parvularculaceae bacterium]